MIVLNLLLFLICIFASIILYYALIARNPYSSELYIGKKGAGKSTYMAKIAKYYNKLGWTVYCNSEIPGTYYFNTSELGIYNFPPNSVICVDEAGICFNNRNWSKLGMHVIKYMKYCRHYRNKLILFTQSNAEIDVTFMRICDRLSLLSNYFNVIGKIRRLRYKQVLIPASETAEARITDDLVPVSIFLGGIKLYWMPSYWKLFDSFDTPLGLQDNSFPYTPYPSYIGPFEPKKVKKQRQRVIKRAIRAFKRCKRILKSSTL